MNPSYKDHIVRWQLVRVGDYSVYVYLLVLDNDKHSVMVKVRNEFIRNFSLDVFLTFAGKEGAEWLFERMALDPDTISEMLAKPHQRYHYERSWVIKGWVSAGSYQLFHINLN
jgi:hypothetical protein